MDDGIQYKKIFESFSDRLDYELSLRTSLDRICYNAKLYQNGVIGDDDLVEDRGYFKGLKVARCILRDIAYEYGVPYEEEIDDDPDEEME